MSEETANLCTTDACESLRARLAKYEDAEGRPVAVLPDHERAKLVNALRDCAKTYAGTGQLRAQIATVLGEFIPLNSSPVSAGEPCKFLKDAERRLNAVLGYSEDFDDLLATVNTACLRIRRLEGSAGVVDERE